MSTFRTKAARLYSSSRASRSRSRGRRFAAASTNNDAFAREVPQGWQRSNAVFADIATILTVLKAAGLLPIYEQVSSYEVGPPSRTSHFYSFFVRGAVHALTIFYIYSLFTENSEQLFFSIRETDNVNQWIELLLCIITYTLTVMICSRNAKTFLHIMNDILRLDEEVRLQCGITLSNNSNFSVKFLVGIAFCVTYIVVLKIYAVPGQLMPISYVLIGFYAVQNGLSTTFILFAAVLLRIVSIRFRYINELLKGYTYNIKRRQLPMEHFPEDTLFVYRMHNKLLRIYRAINECCSLILVGYMGYAFYTITTNTYNLFVQITTSDGIVSAKILQWCFAWLVLHTSLLALLSRSCGQATREANVTSQILARVYGKSKEFQNIIDKFLTKSIKQEVQFTAYGFFVIDNSTLFKIFSAVTTYLVILIQFKQLEDSKVEEQITQPN